MNRTPRTVSGAVNTLQVENQKSKWRDVKLMDHLLSVRIKAAELAAATDEQRRNKDQYEKWLMKVNPILWSQIRSPEVLEISTEFEFEPQVPVVRPIRPKSAPKNKSPIKSDKMARAREDPSDTSFEDFQPIADTPPKPIRREQFFTPMKLDPPIRIELNAEIYEKPCQERRESPNSPRTKSTSPEKTPFDPQLDPVTSDLNINEIEEIQSVTPPDLDHKSTQDEIRTVASEIPEIVPVSLPDLPDTAKNMDEKAAENTMAETPLNAKALTSYAALLQGQPSSSSVQKEESSPKLSPLREDTNPTTTKVKAEPPKPRISIFRADSDSESTAPAIQGPTTMQSGNTNDFDDFWD